jgi:hypothetical protein
MVLLSSRYKALSEEERAALDERATVDRGRYDMEMMAYKAIGGCIDENCRQPLLGVTYCGRDLPRYCSSFAVEMKKILQQETTEHRIRKVRLPPRALAIHLQWHKPH